MHRARKLPGAYFPRAATSDGVLEQHDTDGNRRADYYLQAYGSAHRRLVVSIPQRGTLAGEPDDVAVAGRWAAWIDAHDQAQLARAPGGKPEQATYLGDPIVPAVTRSAREQPVTVVAAFSGRLTHCSISISRRGLLQRTLRCRRADARDGDAVARWKGTDSRGERLPAGRYRWRVRARGRSRTADASGRIAVTPSGVA
jgi:hypothetical protein